MNTQPKNISVAEIDVFFDGDCPVCRLEVDLYEKFAPTGAINWIDITQLGDEALPVGKDRQTLLNRFHVRNNNGDWFVGVDAFARIWQQLPGLRHFAFVFSVPGLRQLAEIGYRGFLKWQRWHRAKRKDQHT